MYPNHAFNKLINVCAEKKRVLEFKKKISYILLKQIKAITKKKQFRTKIEMVLKKLLEYELYMLIKPTRKDPQILVYHSWFLR